MRTELSRPPSTGEGSVFDRLRFVMVRPSHAGNVGAAARAIKTMGFHRLIVVSPRTADVGLVPEARAFASGATDVLDDMGVTDTLAEALAGCTLAFALTARPRDLGPPACDIRTAARASREHVIAHPHGEIAMVLGTERAGLANEDVALCNRICHIPANPDYSSLNVAQAAQLVAWEMRYAFIEEGWAGLLPDTGGHSRFGDEPAGNDKVQALLAHWEEALVALRFLDPAHPKKLMPRMRHLLVRTALSNDEVDMLRGVCTAMIAAARQRAPLPDK